MHDDNDIDIQDNSKTAGRRGRRASLKQTMMSRMYRRKSCTCTWCGGASNFEKATQNQPGLPTGIRKERATPKALLEFDQEIESKLKNKVLLNGKKSPKYRSSVDVPHGSPSTLLSRCSVREGFSQMSKSRFGSFYSPSRKSVNLLCSFWSETMLKKEDNTKQNSTFGSNLAQKLETLQDLEEKPTSEANLVAWGNNPNSITESGIPLNSLSTRIKNYTPKGMTSKELDQFGNMIQTLPNSLRSGLTSLKLAKLLQKPVLNKAPEQSLFSKSIMDIKIKPPKDKVKKVVVKPFKENSKSVKKVYGFNKSQKDEVANSSLQSTLSKLDFENKKSEGLPLSKHKRSLTQATLSSSLVDESDRKETDSGMQAQKAKYKAIIKKRTMSNSISQSIVIPVLSEDHKRIGSAASGFRLASSQFSSPMNSPGGSKKMQGSGFPGAKKNSEREFLLRTYSSSRVLANEA